jgi:hypothetical protein
MPILLLPALPMVVLPMALLLLLVLLLLLLLRFEQVFPLAAPLHVSGVRSGDHPVRPPSF